MVSDVQQSCLPSLWKTVCMFTPSLVTLVAIELVMGVAELAGPEVTAS